MVLTKLIHFDDIGILLKLSRYNLSSISNLVRLLEVVKLYKGHSFYISVDFSDINFVGKDYKDVLIF